MTGGLRPNAARNPAPSVGRSKPNVVVDRNPASGDERIHARARRVDVGGDLLGPAQPSVIGGRLPVQQLDGPGGDSLDQLVADLELQALGSEFEHGGHQSQPLESGRSLRPTGA